MALTLAEYIELYQSYTHLYRQAEEQGAPLIFLTELEKDVEKSRVEMEVAFYKEKTENNL